MPSRILITGGAGFIGSHLAEALIRRGDTVTVLDNFHPFYDPAKKRRNLDHIREAGLFDFIEGDIRDQGLVRSTLQRGFDSIVHLAAMAGVRPSIQDPGLYVSVNLDGTSNLLVEATRAGKPRFLFAGSSSVYGNNTKVPFHEDDPVDHPISPYAATKRAGELLGHTFHAVHGFDFISLRFFTVYGPRQRPEMAIYRFTELINAGEQVPFFGDGSTRRDYTYIDDIVDGIVKALDRARGYRIYNLGESGTTSLSELVGLLEASVGKKAVLKREPLPPGDVQETFADTSRARAEIGYSPTVPVSEGIPRFVSWYLRGRR